MANVTLNRGGEVRANQAIAMLQNPVEIGSVGLVKQMLLPRQL